MNLVSPLASVLSGLVLFFLTGLVALAWLRRRAALEFDLVEACFFVLATSVMAALWVGLVLAEISRFSLVLAAIAIAIAGTCTWLLRPRVPPAPLQKTTWRSGTAALLVLILAIALQAHPSEYLVGGRDPGTYIAAMAMIARHGTIVYRDPAVLSIPHEDVELFYRHPENPPFSWGRFMGFPLEHPSTGRVFPEFFHAFPVFGAYLFQSLGVKGALATSSVFGILGTLAFFFAVRRICDPFVALIASLLLGMNVLQVWFARYPVSETLSQFLFFTGLWAMAHWEKQRLSGWASLAAIAFGLTLFVRIDSVLILVPLALYWAVRQAGADVSRREALTFALPLILLVTHAALHAVFFSRSYAMSIVSRPYWKASALQWSLLGGLAIVVLGIWWRYGARLLAGAARHADRLAKVFLIVFVGAAIYAFAVRPLLSRHAGADGNNSLQLVLENESCLRFASRPQAQCLAAGTTLRVLAQSAAGILVLDPNTKTWGYLAPEALNASADASLPPHAWVRLLLALGYERLAAQDAQALVRLGWFVTPLGLLLALIGIVRLVRTRRNEPRLFLLIFFIFAGFYFYKLRVYHDYFFAARRFIPILLPAVLVLATVVLVTWWRNAGLRRLLAAGLMVFLAAASLRQTVPIVRHVDWAGSVVFIERLAHLFGPKDLVIFEQQASIHPLSLPLWATHGVQILELARWDPNPDQLRHLIGTWRQQYNNIYFVYTYRAQKGLCGVFLQHVQDFQFVPFEWERGYQAPPRKAVPIGFRFTVTRVVLPEEIQVPPLPAIDVGGSDELQVSGFYAREGSGDTTYRWTGPCGSIYLPALRPGDTLRIRASVGRRPLPRETFARVSLAGQTIGQFPMTSDWHVHSLDVPRSLAIPVPILRIDAPTWRPVNVDPKSDDVRDLGVMIESVEIVRAPPQ